MLIAVVILARHGGHCQIRDELLGSAPQLLAVGFPEIDENPTEEEVDQ